MIKYPLLNTFLKNLYLFGVFYPLDTTQLRLPFSLRYLLNHFYNKNKKDTYIKRRPTCEKVLAFT